MTNCYSDGKRRMTPEGVMVVGHASRNKTGQVYVRAMRGAEIIE